MKKSGYEKLNKVYQNIDYARLAKDLLTIEGFTDSTIAKAVKNQAVKGISININGVFYNMVVKPFIERLSQESGLLTISKVGGTRFYTISDRQRAIELFEKPKKQKVQKTLEIKDLKIDPQETVVTEEPEVKEEETLEPILSKSVLDRAFNLGPRNSYGFKKRYLTLVSIFGCFYREKQTTILSSKPKKVLTDYYSQSTSPLKEAIAEFNTAVKSLNYNQFIVKNYGQKRAHKFSIDCSARKILKFLRMVGEIYFPGDKEVGLFLDWSFAKDVTLGVKPKEKKEKPTKEHKSNTISFVDTNDEETLENNAQVETPVDEPESKTSSTVWVVTKMSLAEFMRRYDVDAKKLMESQGMTLVEACIENHDTLDRIKSELREDERINS